MSRPGGRLAPADGMLVQRVRFDPDTAVREDMELRLEPWVAAYGVWREGSRPAVARVQTDSLDLTRYESILLADTRPFTQQVYFPYGLEDAAGHPHDLLLTLTLTLDDAATFLTWRGQGTPLYTGAVTQMVVGQAILGAVRPDLRQQLDQRLAEGSRLEDFRDRETLRREWWTRQVAASLRPSGLRVTVDDYAFQSAAAAEEKEVRMMQARRKRDDEEAQRIQAEEERRRSQQFRDMEAEARYTQRKAEVEVELRKAKAAARRAEAEHELEIERERADSELQRRLAEAEHQAEARRIEAEAELKRQEALAAQRLVEAEHEAEVARLRVAAATAEERARAEHATAVERMRAEADVDLRKAAAAMRLASAEEQAEIARLEAEAARVTQEAESAQRLAGVRDTAEAERILARQEADARELDAQARVHEAEVLVALERAQAEGRQLEHEEQARLDSLRVETERRERLQEAEFDRIEREGVRADELHEIDVEKRMQELAQEREALELAQEERELERQRREAAWEVDVLRKYLELEKIRREDELAQAEHEAAMARARLAKEAVEVERRRDEEDRAERLERERADRALGDRRRAEEAQRQRAREQEVDVHLAAAQARVAEAEQRLGAALPVLDRLAQLDAAMLERLAVGDHQAAEQIASPFHGFQPAALASIGYGVDVQAWVHAMERRANDEGAVAVGMATLVTRDIRAKRKGERSASGVNTLREGDSLQFTIRSRRSGFVTVVNAGTSGAVSVHVPNEYVSVANARVESGRGYNVPGSALLPLTALDRDGLEYREDGPPGWEHLIVLVSDAPLVSPDAQRHAAPLIDLDTAGLDALQQRIATLADGTWAVGVLSFLVH